MFIYIVRFCVTKHEPIASTPYMRRFDENSDALHKSFYFIFSGKRLAPFWCSHYAVMSLPFCHQSIDRVQSARLIFKNKYNTIDCDTQTVDIKNLDYIFGAPQTPEKYRTKLLLLVLLILHFILQKQKNGSVNI